MGRKKEDNELLRVKKKYSIKYALTVSMIDVYIVFISMIIVGVVTSRVSMIIRMCSFTNFYCSYSANIFQKKCKKYLYVFLRR